MVSEGELISRKCIRKSNPYRDPIPLQCAEAGVFILPLTKTEPIQYGTFAGPKGFKKGEIIFDNISHFDRTHADVCSELGLTQSRRNRQLPAKNHIFDYMCDRSLPESHDFSSDSNSCTKWCFLADHAVYFVNSVMPGDLKKQNCNFTTHMNRVHGQKKRVLTMRLVATSEIEPGAQLLERYLTDDEDEEEEESINQ